MTNPDLEVTHELLGALEHVTRSGQSPVMHKVLSILRREALRPNLRLAQPELAALMGARCGGVQPPRPAGRRDADRELTPRAARSRR
jgi:hypothetical protein